MTKTMCYCPFCNGEDVEIVPDGHGWNVGCLPCDYKIHVADCTKEEAIRFWNTRPEAYNLQYDLAQKKAALLIISQWCDWGLINGMRNHEMRDAFLWIRKLAKEEMERNYDED